MGGRSAKVKGSGFERECTNRLKDRGIHAEKVPLSGAAGRFFAAAEADIDIHFAENDIRKVECKRRKDSWKELYKWIEGNDFLFLRSDNKETLVVMGWEDFVQLTKDQIELMKGS
jgi:hypothetical protein